MEPLDPTEILSGFPPPTLEEGHGIGVDAATVSWIEGGSEPWLSLHERALLGAARGGTEDLRIAARLGTREETFRARTSRLSLRWRVDPVPAIRLSVGSPDRFLLEAVQDPGRISLGVCGRLRLGGAVGLDLVARRTEEKGDLLVALDQAPEIAIAWRESRWSTETGLSWILPDRGELRVALGRAIGTPDSLEERYRLRTRSTASRWTLGWTPGIRGPYASLLARHADIDSRASTDTAGSSRRFHAMEIRASTIGWEAGWRDRRWSAGVGWRDHVVEIPANGYFDPFLAWNVFDPSPWSPVDQILSDQREHVQGTLELRRMTATTRRRLAFGPLDLRAGLEAGWWALDPRFLHKTTTLAFLGLGYDVVSDTTTRPRLRAWTLAPSADLALDRARWGSFHAGGELVVPVVVHRLGNAPANATSSAQAEDPTGLWSIRAGWSRSW